MKTSQALFTVLYALGTHALASTMMYTFEDPNSVSNDFTLNQSGSGVFRESSGGLSNSARLRAPSSTNDFAAVVGNGPVSFNTSSDFSFTQSLFFKTTAVAGAENDDEPVILGITDLASQAAPSNYALMQNNFVNAAMRTNSATTAFPADDSPFAFTFLGSSQNSSFTGQAVGAQLQADSWYQLTVDYSYLNATDQWSLAREVFSVDADGLNPLSLVSATTTLNNPFGQNQDIALYGFLAGDSGEAGSVAAFDNVVLVSIPEPSSLALMIIGMAGVFTLLRRKR